MNALDLVYLGGAALLSPWWARKARHGWRERWGYAATLPPPRRPRLLLHAVSVGEVNALRTLVPLLREHAELVLSVGTDTGLARARELFAGAATIVRYPLDFSWCVARFLDAVRPQAVGLVELEVWPNFVAACARRGIPVAVINGRLSERSFAGYRRIRPFIGRTFSRLAAAGVQDEYYARRFIAMGVPTECVTITGSMKWDAAQLIPDTGPAASHVAGSDELALQLGIDRNRPLVVAGSTAEDEEALLHQVCPAGVQLLCAPRKPEHFDEAAAALPGCIRRSATKHGAAPGSATGRFLLDTIGELRRAYALADVVVIGRSFGTLYGSDPIEPAALGKPVVIGPRVSDFAAIVGDLDRAGAVLRTTRARLAEDLRHLLATPAERAARAAAARACIQERQGASARHAELLLKLLKSRLGA